MAGEVPPELVDELYGAPAEEFIAGRDAKAKELRSGGDRALADAVKKLRKPSVSAAAVNRLARVAPEDVSALLAAGEALRQAQFGGADRETIRSAAADERAAVERLVSAAGRLSPAVAEEVRGTLHAAASDDETRELVRRGVLVEPRVVAGFGLGFAPAGSGSRRSEGRVNKGARAGVAPKSGSGRSGSGTDSGSAERAAAEAERAAAERAAEAERKRAAKERVKQAKAALRDGEKAARAAERERDKAAEALAKAERAAEDAAAEVETRRAELETAESP
jgi:hypothetical protein